MIYQGRFIFGSFQFKFGNILSNLTRIGATFTAMILNKILIEPIEVGLGFQHYSLILAVVCLIIFAFLLFRGLILKSKREYRLLALMMTALVALMLSLTIGLNYWNAKNIKNLVLDEQSFEYKGKQVAYKDINKMYIEPSYQKSRYTSSINLDTVNFAIMELKNGKTFIFSEENYDLRRLFDEFKTKRAKN